MTLCCCRQLDKEATRRVLQVTLHLKIHWYNWRPEHRWVLCIRHWGKEVCDCRACGFGKVLVLQHPQGLLARIRSITLWWDHLSIEFVSHQTEQQP